MKKNSVFLMFAVCGVTCMSMRAVVLGICNETGEKNLHMTVYWRLPGKTEMTLFTRESSSSITPYPAAYFTKKCRFFGPVPEIKAVTWFTQQQWDALKREDQEVFSNSSKTTKNAEPYYYASMSKSIKTSWYHLKAEGFGADSIRLLKLSKNKKGDIYVSNDAPFSTKIQSVMDKIKALFSKDVDTQED